MVSITVLCCFEDYVWCPYYYPSDSADRKPNRGLQWTNEQFDSLFMRIGYYAVLRNISPVSEWLRDMKRMLKPCLRWRICRFPQSYCSWVHGDVSSSIILQDYFFITYLIVSMRVKKVIPCYLLNMGKIEKKNKLNYKGR